MVIENYGIRLTRLTEDKIELVRNWRNDPKINQYLNFRGYITPEMQINWFKKINNENNYYFIINYNNEDIGMVNIKDIDYQSRNGEGGIFIYFDKYLNSDISFRVAFCLCDFCFDQLHLNYLIAKILKTNKRAIQYNKMLGYKIIVTQENEECQEYQLSCSDYYASKSKYARLLI